MAASETQKFVRAWLLELAGTEVDVIEPGGCLLLDKLNQRLRLEMKSIQAFEAMVLLAHDGRPALLIGAYFDFFNHHTIIRSVSEPSVSKSFLFLSDF